MELELRDYLRILRKRRWALIGVLVGVLVLAGAFTARQTPVYEAESKLFVGQRQIAATEVAQGQSITQLSFQLLKSYAAILRTRPIAESAVEREGLSVSPVELAEQLRADPILDTQIIRLRYRSTDPRTAQRTVNAVAQVFVEEVERIETPGLEGTDAAVRVSTVEPALTPEEPVSPQPVRNMALALVLGLMGGVGLAFVVEYLDTTVKDREDAERSVGAPVLATVPRIDTHGQELYLERDPQSVAAEAFRKLRTAIQFLGVDHAVKVLLVSSPFAREGKTTTALNLANAYAQAGLRTLIVEADLRRPTLHKVFPTDGQRGLTTALIGRIPLDNAVMATDVRNLSFIPAGALPPNPAELLGSQHMAEILDELRSRFDIVVVDAPPLLPVADASAMAPRADGVILVARAGSTSRDRLQEAAGLVGTVGGRLLGISLNYQKVEGKQYGYQYYGYRAPAGSFESKTDAPQAASRPKA